MKYKILIVEMGLIPSKRQDVADKLSSLVNDAIADGWTPQGGVCFGVQTIFQAMVRND